MIHILEYNDFIFESEVVPYKYISWLRPNIINGIKASAFYFFGNDNKLSELKVSDMGKDLYTAFFQKKTNDLYNLGFNFDNDRELKDTKRNEPFKIMSTINYIIRDFFSKTPGAKKISLEWKDDRRRLLYDRAIEHLNNNDFQIEKLEDRFIIKLNNNAKRNIL